MTADSSSTSEGGWLDDPNSGISRNSLGGGAAASGSTQLSPSVVPESADEVDGGPPPKPQSSLEIPQSPVRRRRSPEWLTRLAAIFPDREVEERLRHDETSAIAVTALVDRIRERLEASGKPYSLRLLIRTDSEDDSWTRYIIRIRLAESTIDERIGTWREVLAAKAEAKEKAYRLLEAKEIRPRGPAASMILNTMIHVVLD